MPVGFNSPARNLFLLGSSGEQVVTNFFKTIDQSAGTDGVYLPDEIKYIFADQKFSLAGSASDSNSKGFGWFEKRDQDGTADWDVRVEAGVGVNTTLRAMELDTNDNLIVVGKTADIPWIAKYSNGGVIDWQSTTNSADVEYTGITSDSSGNYYACGNTPIAGEAQAFVEKFDASGNPGWGKSAFMLGRDVVLNKVAANSRGEVVAVGYLEDDTANKGYIVKIDTNTGEVLWDKTLSSTEYGSNFLNPLVIVKGCICLGVYIDSKDQIYVCGYKQNIDTYDVGYIIKFTPEGNIIWQKEMRGDPTATVGFDGLGYRFTDVKADGETEQVVVLSESSVGLGGSDISLYKFSKDGSVVFRRRLASDRDGISTRTGIASLDADPSFYYLLFVDQSTSGLNGTPDKYTFGKVSTSGNGLGDFEYTSDVGVTIDYTYATNTGDLSIVDGIISDGSVRNDTSNLKTYPFSANKLLFDDLATQVANKKRQMDSADSFEYSGSPAIRVADFQELNLLADTEATQRINDVWIVTSNVPYGTTQYNVFSSGSFTYVGPDENFSDGLQISISCQISSGQFGNLVEATGYLEDENGNIVEGSTVTKSGINFSMTVASFYLNFSGTYKLMIDFNVTLPPGNSPFTLLISADRYIYSLTPGQDGVWKDQSGKGNDIIESSKFPYAYPYSWPTLNAASVVSGSVSFDGNNDYLEVPRSDGFDFGTGSFTMECFAYFSSYISEGSVLFGKTQSSGSAGIAAGMSLSNSGEIFFLASNNSGYNVLVSGGTLSLNRWYHLAFVRSGNSFYGFVDGVLSATATNSNAISNDTTGTFGGITMGAYSSAYGSNAGRYPFNGYISNLRIVKGASLYTSNFTPPTAPLSPVTGTELLTCQSPTTITDVSSNNFTIAVNGNAAAINIGPTTSGSVSFDGTGDYLSVTSNTAVGFGTGDFTVEGWFYSTANQGAFSSLVSLLDATGGSDWQISVDSNVLKVYNPSDAFINTSTTFSNNAWHHFAWTRQGTTNYLFLDGTQYASVTDSTNWDYGQVLVGRNRSGVYFFTGYISNLRIVKGTALYTSNFTPPTALLTAVTNTVLLTCQSPSTITDASSNNFTITANGNAAASSVTPALENATAGGPGYWEFDGVNDGITIPYTPKLAFTDAIFSLEAWIYIDDLTNRFPIINKRDNYAIDNTNRPYILEVNSDGVLRFSLDFPDGGPFTTICETSTGAIVTGQWYHLAAVHDGTTSKIYINGSESASVASGTTSLENTGDVPTRIGYRYTGSSISYGDGRISEVRIYPRAITPAQVFQNYNATREKYTGVPASTDPGLTSTRTPA